MRFTSLCLGFLILGCGDNAAQNQAGVGGSAAASGGRSSSPSGGSSSTAGGQGGASTNSSGGSSADAGATSTGGTSGETGGTGGDGGAPHIVEACPTGDNAPDSVGVWENITPPDLIGKNTPGGAIVVNPKDTRIVYAGSADHGGVFKSTDCGASFVHINTGSHAEDIDSGFIWDMAIDPVNPDTLYVIEGYGAGGLWKTTNGGVDWENTTPTGSEVANTANANFTSIVGMDVTDPLHLVLAFHSGCSGDYAPLCQAETTDGGDTWRLLKAPVGGEGSGVIVINATTWLVGGYLETWQTTDSGESWDKVSDTSPHWQVYRSTSGALYIGTMQGILKSTDGTTWSLIPGFNQQVQGITGDGTNIFAGQQWGVGLFKIPEDDTAAYTNLPPSGAANEGPYFMSYDPDHHILYGSNFGLGHIRMVTE